jgi:S1-C subfamily serine protease
MPDEIPGDESPHEEPSTDETAAASEPIDPFTWDESSAPVEQAATPPPRRGRILLAAVVAAVVLLTGGIGIGWELARSGNNSTPLVEGPLTAASPANPTGPQAAQSLDVQAIANKVDPAVVDINVVITDALGRRGAGAGTGMIVTSSGEVLTNNHVIEGATSIAVSITGRSGRYAAKALGASPSGDVALLQIHGASGLPTVTLANSSSLVLGQQVVAIGNALGQGGDPTVTEGAISALDRTVALGDGRGGAERLTGLIQTTAPIQPGDSGGPLVNAAGQVVGMVTAGARGNSESGSSVGFAIASNNALSIVNQIRAGHGSASVIIGQPGFLGVGVRDLNAATAKQLGLPVTSGALILHVTRGGPAERAGMATDAVITAVDGKKVGSAADLGPAIHRHKPGDQMQVTWVDRSGTHTATVRLTTGPAV